MKATPQGITGLQILCYLPRLVTEPHSGLSCPQLASGNKSQLKAVEIIGKIEFNGAKHQPAGRCWDDASLRGPQFLGMETPLSLSS